jgi:coenzyme PQQ precursor peptide PqqA
MRLLAFFGGLGSEGRALLFATEDLEEAAATIHNSPPPAATVALRPVCALPRKRAGHILRGRLHRACQDNREPLEEATMEWRTPKLVEIACGCEINAYFPADL